MQDRRIKRTQHLLARALVDLSAEKDYESITIRDITERANIGYATFFRHYRSKEALLLDVLADVVDDLIRLLEPTTAQGKLEEAGRQLFEFVARERMLLQILLAAQGTPAIQTWMRETAVERILATSALPPNSSIPPEIIAHHLLVSSTALIQWWLEHGMPLSPEQMGYIYALLIVKPAHEAAESVIRSIPPS